MSIFFERFSLLCKDAGTSPNAIAKKLSVSSGSVTAWKNGTYPRTETIQKIADFFHVSADYLIGNVSEPYFYLDNDQIKRELNSYGDEDKESAAPTWGDEDMAIIQRERNKMTDKEKARFMNILRANFDEYNWDADDSGNIE